LCTHSLPTYLHTPPLTHFFLLGYVEQSISFFGMHFFTLFFPNAHALLSLHSDFFVMLVQPSAFDGEELRVSVGAKLGASVSTFDGEELRLLVGAKLGASVVITQLICIGLFDGPMSFLTHTFCQEPLTFA